MAVEFRGKHLEFLHDTTSEIDLEGALACGKTTVALWKELTALVECPGIWILLCRWTDDAVGTLLRPAFEQLARIRGIAVDWQGDKEKHYLLENGSRAYAFGLKTQSSDPEQRYGKIRGLPVSRIYMDQAEQCESDIAGELRLRLRPDIEARQRGEDYPRQLTFTPNPTNYDHFLAKQFPDQNNPFKNRKYYSLSLFDNRHNLPDDIFENALTMYPPEHPKHRTVILGLRGLNVSGDPIYEDVFIRKHHVAPVKARNDLPILEAFEVGRHNPCWVASQRGHDGKLTLLGGVTGKHMVLDHFLPFVQQQREDWFKGAQFKTCTAPMGETESTSGTRYTMLKLLREAGYRAVSKPNANAADVQLAMIEQLAGMLQRRTLTREESFAINDDPAMWLTYSNDGSVKHTPFMAFAFDGGYVWDKHTISISHKSVRQPFEDDEYANAMHCLENIVLNFCAGRPTDLERAAKKAALRANQEPSTGRLERSPLDWAG